MPPRCNNEFSRDSNYLYDEFGVQIYVKGMDLIRFVANVFLSSFDSVKRFQILK
jgi:hypothetical protein